MSALTKYASLVKFSHTVFAMPFALTSYFYAMWSSGTPFDAWLLVKILVAMVCARNAAMGLNRYADRDIDALNPRTAEREIPAGRVTPRNALWFVGVNVALFVAAAFWINTLAGCLAPLALFVLLGYNYTKRYTTWCHLVLGVALGLAALGAYVAVLGGHGLWAVLGWYPGDGMDVLANSPFIYPALLAGLVLTWVSGFDIIYSLQDIGFDRANGLHSIPARLGVRGGLAVSVGLHVVSMLLVWLLGRWYDAGTFYWIGASLFVLTLLIQHLLATPRRLDRIGPMFGVVNGLASICFALFAILDLWVRFRA